MSRLAWGAALAVVGALGAATSILAQDGRPPSPPPPPAPRVRDEHRAPPAGSVPSTIRGRLVSHSGNPPPTGVRVRALGPFPKGTDRLGVQVEPGKDGSFEIPGVWSGCAYSLAVVVDGASGHELGRSEPVAAGTLDAIVTLRPGGKTHGTIRGRVVDSAGLPVGPGVPVGAAGMRFGPRCGNRNPGETGSTTTREDGTFVIEFLDDYPFSVHAGRGEGGAAERAEAHFVSLGASDLILRLGPAPVDPRKRPAEEDRVRARYTPAPTAITGRLVPKGGARLPIGKRVRVRKAEERDGRVTAVDPSGAFDTGALEPGAYTLLVESDSDLEIGRRDGVEPGTQDLEIAIESVRSIEGVLHLPSGEPAGAGYRVVADANRPPARYLGRGSRARTTTLPDGTFRIDYLGDFEFALGAQPPPEAGARERRRAAYLGGIRPGTAGVALRLVDLVELSGTLLDADGRPRGDIEIVATDPASRHGSSGYTQRTGRFHLRGLFEGRVRVVARIPVAGSSRTVEVDLGEFEAPAEGLELRLPRE